VPALEAVLDRFESALGRDAERYRNHTYRVFNLCAALHDGSDEAREKLALAVAFHDLGIWTDGTFDYLAPSVRLAAAHLRASGRDAWVPEITQMILQHHKVLPAGAAAGALVEAFRRADWIDVSRGTVRFGLPRSFVRELYAAWPDSGFHRFLIRQSWDRVRTHPLSPLPMLRW
jgi:hypothetical protein